MAFNFQFNSNGDEILAELENACVRALERIGSQAEGYAVDLVPVDTGNLRSSITHTVDTAEKVAYVGTANKYAVYVEMGTGLYVDGGRKTPWVYNLKLSVFRIIYVSATLHINSKQNIFCT